MKEAETFVRHILECIELIEEYTENKSKGSFLESVQLQDSIIRRIEIIGEAVKNLPDEIKEKYPGIPWRKIAGTRDFLIHSYFGIDLELTWQAVKRDIPALKKEMLKIAKDIKIKY